MESTRGQEGGDTPEVPKITKTLPIMKWTEAFQDYLHWVIGVRVIPLVYTIYTNIGVPIPAPPLAPNQPYSQAHGSIEYELVEMASHENPLFRVDNSEVYFKLEEATHGTTYTLSIKPFNVQRMEVRCMQHSQVNTQVEISGSLRYIDKTTYYTIMCGRDNLTSHLRDSSHNIRTTSYPCNNVPNM